MFSNSSDPFSECTTKEEAIDCYSKRLEEIKEIAKHEYGIDASQFAEMFEQEFLCEQLCGTATPISTVNCKQISKRNEFYKFQKNLIDTSMYVYSQTRRYMFRIVVFAIMLILVNYRAELSRVFMRKIQVYIYPGMRLWRKLTLPIIQQFPQLTQFYDETCLVSNPFFRVANLDCSPCVDVINVVDLSKVSQFDYLGCNIPHIIQQVRDKPK